jgi:hypothetical protein
MYQLRGKNLAYCVAIYGQGREILNHPRIVRPMKTATLLSGPLITAENTFMKQAKSYDITHGNY